MGYPSTTVRPLSEALQGIEGKYDLVYAYEAASAEPWRRYSAGSPAYVNTLRRAWVLDGATGYEPPRRALGQYLSSLGNGESSPRDPRGARVHRPQRRLGAGYFLRWLRHRRACWRTGRSGTVSRGCAPRRPCRPLPRPVCRLAPRSARLLLARDPPPGRWTAPDPARYPDHPRSSDEPARWAVQVSSIAMRLDSGSSDPATSFQVPPALSQNRAEEHSASTSASFRDGPPLLRPLRIGARSAVSVPSNPTREWVPSQSGLLAERPQRQSEVAPCVSLLPSVRHRTGTPVPSSTMM